MKKLQHPRGNTAANDLYTGLPSQLTVDSERWELRLHDGETPGGHRILNLEQLLMIFMSKDSEFGDVAFGAGDKGILTRIGDRQYALRSLIGYNGIVITESADEEDELNPKGTNTDFYIGIDPDALDAAANRIPWVLTTGTADDFEVTLPDTWKHIRGAIFGMEFHLTANEGASLTVHTGSGDFTHPLKTADNSTRVDLVGHASTECIVMFAQSSWNLIGMLRPQKVGIEDIDGMTATNVQDALEELNDRIGGGGDGSAFSQWQFAGNGVAAFSGGAFQIPLTDGQTRFVTGQQASFRMRTGDSPDQNFTYSAALLKINGTDIGGSDGGTDAHGPGPGISVIGMLERVGTNIYWWPITNTHRAGALYTAANGIYGKIHRIHCGIVSSGATTVAVSGTLNDQTGWTYSNAGAAV